MHINTRSFSVAGITLTTVSLVLLAACGSGSSNGNGSAYGAPTPTPTPTTIPVHTAADVATSTTSKLATPILVDATGFTIYHFVPDGNSTTSTVPAAIRPNWPPVTAASMP